MRVAEDRATRDRPGGRVTIADVSDALGLTKSTVSRALNGYPDIADSTRLRVRNMADSMGYRPLSHAQAIRTGLVKSVGLVIQTADHDAQRPFLAEFLAGVSEGASAEGWTLTLAAAESDAETLETFRAMIRDRKVDGFILPRSMVRDPRIALLRAEKVPFVLFGRTEEAQGCVWFDILGEEAMRDAVHRLAGLGHRRIGFINGGSRYFYAGLRREGFLGGLAEVGLPISPEMMGAEAVTVAEGRAVAHGLLADPEPPTAIVCAVDMAALGVYRAAEDLGLRIGKDLATISYDGVPDGAHVTPPLTTYAVDFIAAGRALSGLLIRQLRGEPPDTLRDTALARFLDRGSAGPATLTPAELAARISNHKKR